MRAARSVTPINPIRNEARRLGKAAAGRQAIDAAVYRDATAGDRSPQCVYFCRLAGRIKIGQSAELARYARCSSVTISGRVISSGNDLRASGDTNMYGAGPYLIEEFGFTRRESHIVLKYWMATFRRDTREEDREQ